MVIVGYWSLNSSVHATVTVSWLLIYHFLRKTLISRCVTAAVPVLDHFSPQEAQNEKLWHGPFFFFFFPPAFFRNRGGEVSPSSGCIIKLIHGHWLCERGCNQRVNLPANCPNEEITMCSELWTASHEPFPYPEPFNTAHLFELALTRSRPHSEERLVKVIRSSLSSLL